MQRLLAILAIFLAFKCFSYDEYLFCPQGELVYGHSVVSKFSLDNCVIYGVEKNQKKILIGTVEKLREWTRAYVFKIGDTVLSTHRASLLSVGTLFDRLKTFEIYDENNQLIGLIEGIWDANDSACFFFYKENREFFAKANLDRSYSKLTISTPEDEILITGQKTLQVYGFPKEYSWKIKKEKEQPFNAYFLWPFLGFLSEVWLD